MGEKRAEHYWDHRPVMESLTKITRGKAISARMSPFMSLYEIIAECPAFQSGDECINENNSLLISITWDADRDAPPFKAGRVH